ncbi:hypothetical protein TIFTF001_024294 [Ficus carica]|uniref:Uncharacterized protein n=1 Tax=Ficus carica TaxID=3494 RepID=A0AA88AHS2_FICCA|nr:hypothetical protein TIFTF001_024294 [Ficus carica]
MSFQFEHQNSLFSFEGLTFDGVDQEILCTPTQSLNQYSPMDNGYCRDGHATDEFVFSIYELQQQHQQSWSPGDPQKYEISPQIEASPTMEPNIGVKEYPFSLAALEILNNHGSGFKRLKGRRIIVPYDDTATINEGSEDQKRSTEEILRIAGERFIKYSSQQATGHPFRSSFSGLSYEEMKNVELVELLLSSAEKVECQQYESARRLLNLCGHLSSDTGNPVQRVVYYLCESLKEKIDRETGGISSKGTRKNFLSFDVDKAMEVPDAPKLAFHRELPFSQLEKFAGIQAIVENIGEAKKIHVIDLRIANGVQWTALMQALASRQECQIELLKITALVTNSKHAIEGTGKWLSNFASTMNVPFSFKVVMVPNMLDLKEDLFELDADETIAVYSSFALRSMLAQPAQLESLMRVIRGLNPCVMVVAEVEANHNSRAFVNRFIEALFFYGTMFECLETFMKGDEPNRVIVEALYCFEAMRNIVACEGEERKIRNVKFDVWRAFFERCGMEELELSPSSIYQAKLVTKNFALGSSCTLEMDGKCLMMGWKGTPLQSLSVWKFL